MNKIFAIAFSVVVVAAVPALADHRPGHTQGGGGQAPSIKASNAKPVFGQSITFTGTARNTPAGTAVEIWQNPYPYAAFTNTGRAGVVDPTGNYTVTGVKPRMHTQYKAVVRTSPAPVESGTEFVQVALRVSFRVSDSTPRRGARVRFYGTVSPSHPGKTVSIQRRDRTGKFVTVARTRTNSRSRYSRRLRVRSRAVYRIFVAAADQDHLDGTSRSRTLRPHR